MIIFACVASSPVPTTNPSKSGFIDFAPSLTTSIPQTRLSITEPLQPLPETSTSKKEETTPNTPLASTEASVVHQMMTAATSVFTNADSDKEAIGEPPKRDRSNANYSTTNSIFCCQSSTRDALSCKSQNDTGYKETRINGYNNFWCIYLEMN
nr:unnamed protein product [Callosobruchus chinensis]